jgi:DNA repair exonuclease SbcCD ATPase subunit
VRVLKEEKQQLQQLLDGAVQALATDRTTQAREEEPGGPIRRADADRLRQLEASNSKLEEDLRELEELDRDREAATKAQAKQHMEAYETLRGDLKAEKQAHEKDVGELQRQLNERGDRHKSELAALKRQHEAVLAANAAELDAKQKIIQDQERLVKKYKRDIEELKRQGASVKAEPCRDNEPDQTRSSRVSVKEEPGRDPQPDQQRSSSVPAKTEPGCDPQPDQQRSSNDASLSSPPKSKTKVETGAAGAGKK